MKKISELTAQPTSAEMLQWRDGYRHHLESKGIPPESAADLAAKVSYRADLYPTDLAATRPYSRSNRRPHRENKPRMPKSPAKRLPARQGKAH